MANAGNRRGFGIRTVTSLLPVVAAVAMGLSPPQALAQRSCFDLSLVLAIDASSSISDEEYRLQMSGAAAALRSTEVQAALRQAGQVAIAAVIWSSDRTPKQYLPWMPLHDEAEAEALAQSLETLQRPMKGDTGLGAGLEAAIGLLGSGPCSIRKVINVSGDGRETPLTRYNRQSLTPDGARLLADEAGIEINALVIADEETDLRSYFERNVITGPDAFVIEIDSFADVETAFMRKLVREISPRQVSAVAQPGRNAVR